MIEPPTDAESSVACPISVALAGRREPPRLAWPAVSGMRRTTLSRSRGSLAGCLLNRPHSPKIENRERPGRERSVPSSLASNFELIPRSMVASWADCSVNELDLHARHLGWHDTAGRKRVEAVADSTPEWFDAKHCRMVGCGKLAVSGIGGG